MGHVNKLVLQKNKIQVPKVCSYLHSMYNASVRLTEHGWKLIKMEMVAQTNLFQMKICEVHHNLDV